MRSIADGPSRRRPSRSRAEVREAASEHPWDAGIFPIRTLLGDQPGARVTAALVVAGDKVLAAEMSSDTLGPVAEVVDALDAALERAERDTGVAPHRVRVRHRELARGLRPRLAVRGIEVAHEPWLPDLLDAADALSREVGDANTLPLVAAAPTWKGWGLSAGRCRALFAAAAHFRRAAPWQRLGDDDPLSVIGDHEFWIASVLGAAHEEYGLVAYTDSNDYDRFNDEIIDDPDALAELEGSILSLSFVSRNELTREMQREVAAAGWEVADPDGYPILFTFNTPAGGLEPRLVDDLTGILLAVPDFLDARADAITVGLAGDVITWNHPGTRFTLRYELPGGFEWPVPETFSPGGPEGPGAEPGALLPPPKGPDEMTPDADVVEAFEAFLLESFSETTARKHARNAGELVTFLNDKQGVPLRGLHEHDLRSFLYDAYPRSRPGHAQSEAMATSLRRFFDFLEESHGLRFPWAEPLVDDRTALRRRVGRAPGGAWWDGDVMDFRADLWEDLERRAMMIPDEWGGALEARPFMGITESRLQKQAERRWLVWRDALIRDGIDTHSQLRDALMERLLDWLDQPLDDEPDGPTRLERIRAERNAAPPGQQEKMFRAIFGEEP